MQDALRNLSVILSLSGICMLPATASPYGTVASKANQQQSAAQSHTDHTGPGGHKAAWGPDSAGHEAVDDAPGASSDSIKADPGFNNFAEIISSVQSAYRAQAATLNSGRPAKSIFICNAPTRANAGLQEVTSETPTCQVKTTETIPPLKAAVRVPETQSIMEKYWPDASRTLESMSQDSYFSHGRIYNQQIRITQYSDSRKSGEIYLLMNYQLNGDLKYFNYINYDEKERLEITYDSDQKNHVVVEKTQTSYSSEGNQTLNIVRTTYLTDGAVFGENGTTELSQTVLSPDGKIIGGQLF